jgi:arginine/ornithine N-succinyltransferase beta subunit
VNFAIDRYVAVFDQGPAILARTEALRLEHAVEG